MGLDLTALATKTAKCDITYMGQTCTVTYRPSALTTELISALDTPSADEDRFSKLLLDLITDWDVMKSKKKVPLTVAGLRPLPIVLLRAIYLGLLRETGSGEASAPSSDG